MTTLDHQLKQPVRNKLNNNTEDLGINSGLTVNQDMQAAKKSVLLDKLVELGTVTKAAEAIGIDPSTAWRWCQADPEFKANYEDKLRAIGDKYIDRGNDIAFNDKHPMSGTMTMFMIKRYHPEFRDNPPQQQAVQDNRQIIFNIQGGSDAERHIKSLMAGGQALINQEPAIE